MQKLNNDQLRQLYFQPSTPSKSFHKQNDHIKTGESRQSFFDTPINYEKFSESEIARFEKFFNTYLYPTPQNDMFKNPQTSQKAHDLLEATADHQPEPQLKSEKAQIEVKPASVDNEAFEDHDLTYLETLMNHGVSKKEPPHSSSLSDLFAEIIDNEKQSISNYESSVFDANVQMLFDEESSVPSQPAVAAVVETPKAIPPTPPPLTTPEVAVELPLPPPPIAPKIAEEAAAIPNMATFPTASVEIATDFTQETKTAPVEEFVPKKEKKSRIKPLDLILILIILGIFGALGFHFRDSLPF